MSEKGTLRGTDGRPSISRDADEKETAMKTKIKSEGYASETQTPETEAGVTRLDSKAVTVGDSKDEEDEFRHLPPHEAEVLRRQVFVPKVKIGVKDLYRYATTWDLIIMAVSAVAAIAGGAALPLMTVRILSLPRRLMLRNLGYLRSVVRHFSRLFCRNGDEGSFQPYPLIQCPLFCIPGHCRICCHLHLDGRIYLHW